VFLPLLGAMVAGAAYIGVFSGTVGWRHDEVFAFAWALMLTGALSAFPSLVCFGRR